MNETEFLAGLLKQSINEDVKTLIIDRIVEISKRSLPPLGPNHWGSPGGPLIGHQIQLGPCGLQGCDFMYPWGGTTPQPCRKCGRPSQNNTIFSTVSSTGKAGGDSA